MKTIIDGRKQFVRDFTAKEGLQGSLGGKKGKAGTSEVDGHPGTSGDEDKSSLTTEGEDPDSLSRKFRRIMKETR